ncbi:hypothetical protein PO124_09015 [Bacillus licheniformis]|nr:hypothetical protein [Bacillus licheniformis]
MINYFKEEEIPKRRWRNRKQRSARDCRSRRCLKEDDVKALIRQAVDSFGSVDVMVNNAGVEMKYLLRICLWRTGTASYQPI